MRRRLLLAAALPLAPAAGGFKLREAPAFVF